MNFLKYPNGASGDKAIWADFKKITGLKKAEAGTRDEPGPGLSTLRRRKTLPSSNIKGNHGDLKRSIKRGYSVPIDLEQASLGARLRAFRKKAGISVAEVAVAAGLSVNCIRQIEANPRRPKLEKVGRLVKFYGPRIGEVFPPCRDVYEAIAPVKDFGTWLKNFRLRNCLTQHELAKMWGVSWVCVSRYESNLVKPTPPLMERLKDGLGLDDAALAGILDVNADFGSWLRDFRLRRGLTQEQLGRAWGVPAATVGRYEANLRSPGLGNLKRLKAALNLNGEADQFMEFFEKRQRTAQERGANFKGPSTGTWAQA